ncbi:MAG: hypothetical protein ACYCQJ_12260 [Nitrososphaerales archaeon]
MGSSTTMSVIAIACIITIMTPLAITSLALSQKPMECDYIDEGTGLNVADYLLGLGISGLISAFFLILTLSVVFCCDGSPFVALINILPALFNFAWMIVGAVILFRSNLECIQASTPYVIYALVMWCFSVWTFCL